LRRVDNKKTLHERPGSLSMNSMEDSMKRFPACVFILLILSLGIGTARASETYTLTLATWGAPSHPHESLFAKQFIDLVEKNSKGQIKFKYFSRGTMVKQSTVPDALIGGSVDIALTIIDSWAGRHKDVSVTATPLWTLSMEQDAQALLPGRPLYDHFNKLLEEDGVELLCLFDIGPTVIVSKAPMRAPADIHGKVIRSLSKGSAQVLQALGASPIVLNVGDVYSALQRGTIDGAMNGIQGAVGLKYSEVVGNVLVPNGVMGTLISGYAMNRKKLTSLPPDLRAVVTNAALEVRNAAQKKMVSGYFDYLKELEKEGMKPVVLRRDTKEWDAWSQALADFRTSSAKEYSPEVLRLIKASAANP
jgi:TRAP-type transport system periplasmic protein